MACPEQRGKERSQILCSWSHKDLALPACTHKHCSGFSTLASDQRTPMDPVPATALAETNPWKQRAFLIHHIHPLGMLLALAAHLGNDWKNMPFYHNNYLPLCISLLIFKQANSALTRHSLCI